MYACAAALQPGCHGGQRKRSVELLRLIDLDFSVTECFLDLPPVREYDLYIKSYGMANTRQAYVQSNEDNTERDTQTEETDLIPKWTQHPPESSVACGGPQVSQNASGEAVTATTVDSKRLAAFLRSAAQVRSCCFSPGKATLVFAGTDVGSVLVWDLREPSSSHTHIRVCEEVWTLRHPTFSTDAVLSGLGHFSSVVSVEPIPVNMGAGLRDPLLSEQEGSLGLWFQLGSLDENGLLNLWVVVELQKADESGSQTDLGLRPGGKVKLLHSSSLQTTPQVEKGVLGVTSHLSAVLKFLPSDSNHYFIGSNMVGCTDGSVRLHALACADAVCEWTLGSGRSSVRCVGFSPTRCSVFCALDSASVLHIWNLTQRDESPLITHDFSTDPVSAMTLFGDASRKNPFSGIALAKHSGKLEIHFLISSLTLPQASDVEILHSLTQDTL
ncbi:WD repeat-containing protein 60 [Bagarius yarrelli]|uniref:WD repeat-containing protein 60 n=1 Tax=Bagarius yarrelli TaxID=175774 RepID=A0A556VWJ1_BAGYA|nr:WD repeat-containing protein 60 [Bagarius yarrelli]